MDEFLVSVLAWAAGILGGLSLVGLLSWKLGFLRVVTVKEGRAVAFQYRGRFIYCAMEFGKHAFRVDGSICDGLGANEYGSCWCIWRFGGWIFYLWPFIQPAQYNDYNDADKFGAGVKVNLNDITSEPSVAVQKTAKPENVALSVMFVVTMRIVNPYLHLFVSPKDVINQVIKRIEGVLRAWIENHKQDYVQDAKGNGGQLWQDLIALGHMTTFDEIRNRWGIEILPGSIVVREVNYADPTYQAALEATSKATLLADAEVAKISAIDKAMDHWVKAEAKKMGISIAEALVVLKADGSWKRQRDIYMSQILADANANLLLVGNPDGTPIAGDLAPAIALFAAAGAARGGGRQGGNRGKGSGGGSQQTNKTPEQAAQEFFNQRGIWPHWDPQKRQPSV